MRSNSQVGTLRGRPLSRLGGSVEVEMDPELVRNGHDPQLEKAVETVMELLRKSPLPEYKKPAYPDYHQKLAQP